MNWYLKYKFSGYNTELAYLRDHFKSGFDPFDFSHKIRNFLEKNYEMREEWEELEDYEIIEEWNGVASEEDKEAFEEYVTNESYDNYFTPAYLHMNFERVVSPGWLVHFTDDPFGIKNNGFIYGHPPEYGYEGLAYTTWKTKRHTEPGFNFAFQIGTRDANFAARNGKYGNHCIVFLAAGVKCYHYGDEESQILFWGPAVKKDMIFPVYNGDEGYCVQTSNREFCFEKFEDACDWITQNYRMIQNINDKDKRRYIEQRKKQKKGEV